MFSLRHLRIVALIAISILVPSCGGGGGGDGWPGMFPLWVETDVKVADIDGDGRPDLVTLSMLSTSMSHDEGRLTVRLQTAPGVFSAPQSYVVGVYPWRMAIADIDGDGAPDIVITDAKAKSVWMLRQNTANRGLFLAPHLLLAANTTDLAVGDVNGDGVPDVVLAYSLSPDRGATVLYQDAANRGTFLAPVSVSLPGDATRVAIGDVNGDGKNDIVFRMFMSETNYVHSHSLGVVYQQTGGILGPAVSLSPQTGINTTMLAITDYNGDGVNDLVEFFTPSSTDFRAKVTTLLQSKPAGFFTAVDTSLAGVDGIDDAVAADLNDDAKPDLAVVGFYPVGSPTTVHSTLSIFLQNGTGAFVLSRSIELPNASSRIAAGDLNGDGLTDLVVLGDENQVLVLLQSTTSPGTFLTPQRLI